MKPLLILIDLQEGWRHKTATEPTMVRCAELSKQFQGDIILCCFKNKPGGLFETQLSWTRFREAEDTNQISEIQSQQLPVYWRETYSCLTEEVTTIVKQHEHVYIAGVFTDASVYATALGVFDLGIAVTIIKDCVATLHGEQVHTYALRALEHIIDRKHLVPMAELPISVCRKQG